MAAPEKARDGALSASGRKKEIKERKTMWQSGRIRKTKGNTRKSALRKARSRHPLEGALPFQGKVTVS